MVLVDASHEDQDERAPESIRKWHQRDNMHPGWKKLKYFFQLHLGWARLTADRDVPEFWSKAFREEENFLTLPTKREGLWLPSLEVKHNLAAIAVVSLCRPDLLDLWLRTCTSACCKCCLGLGASIICRF